MVGSMNQSDYQQQQSGGSPNRGFVNQQQQAQAQQGQRGNRRRMRRSNYSRF